MTASSHLWIRGRHRHERRRLLDGLELASALATVDAHRRLRGPYTAAGTLLRTIVPAAWSRLPELVTRHDIEILSTTPELRDQVPATRETLTSLAVPRERTRFYSRLRTLRIAHGLTDFLLALRRAEPSGPVCLIVENAHEADPTDGELLAVLLRRVDPELIRLVVCTSTAPLTDAEPVTEGLGVALQRHARPLDAVQHDDLPPWTDAAAAYVASDGTDDHPLAHAAYLALPAASRAALHDERAAELTELAELGEPSLRLGALPWHLECGSDPAGAGADALRHALDYCVDMGFYHATVELGARGRAVVDWTAQAPLWWTFTTKMTTSLAALGWPQESEPLYDEARALSQSPAIHMQAAYATAMLYTRHLEPDRRNHTRARAWLNQAIAFAGLLPHEADRAFNEAFNRNGLALVEVHVGDLPAALWMVSSGLDTLDAALAPGEHSLHRSVLRYNRAQVYAAMGRLDEALADYTAVIELDPNYPEYHFDRGNLLRRMGRPREALADYQRAIELSPPFPEVYYNRGDTLAELGDPQAALADFGYVLELEPGHVDARVNRAGLLVELGRDEDAARDVAAGMAADPANPHLLCLHGQLLAARGQLDEARTAYTQAIDLDPTVASAWALRGVLLIEAGELAAALADLDRAAELTSSSDIAFNRAAALQAAGRYADAVTGYDTVLAAVDDPDARIQRELCLARVETRPQPSLRMELRT